MNTQSLRNRLQQTLQPVLRMRLMLFILLLLALYGFIAWRISTLAAAEPDAAAVASKSSSTSKPNVDPTIVEKVEKLEDSSVNVQSLFNDARKNPFGE